MNNMRHNNMVLLGEPRYGISRWLMTPLRNPETRGQIAFNTLFTKERVMIEMCFGGLKRFPILLYMFRVQLDRVVSASCAVPRDISKHLNDSVPVDEQEDDIKNRRNIIQKMKMKMLGEGDSKGEKR
nr:unnamed protein product [Callosobruchus analis]